MASSNEVYPFPEENIAISIFLSLVILLIYDYLLTFEHEVSLIWHSPWNTIKIAFLCIRYAPFVDMPMILYYTLVPVTSETTCRVLTIFSQWLIMLGIWASEGILFKRTWALWNQNMRLAVALWAFFLAAFSSVAIMCIFWQSTFVFPGDIDEISTNRRCLLLHESKIFVAMLSVIIFSETLVLVLTVARLMRYHLSKQPRIQSELVYVLYRDGITFSLSLLLNTLANVIVLEIASMTGSEKYALLMLQHGLRSVTSARVLLHLRETQRTEETLQSASDIEFRVVSPRSPERSCASSEDDNSIP